MLRSPFQAISLLRSSCISAKLRGVARATPRRAAAAPATERPRSIAAASVNFSAFSQQRAYATSMSQAPLLQGLKVLKGDPINMKADLGKKVFVIEFWATWCPPCKASIPHLTELSHKYKSQGVQVIGITQETGPVVDRFVQQMGSKMDYTVAVDDGTADEYMTRYNVQGIPHSFIVDRKGKIIWNGHPMDPQFEANLAKAVAEAAPVPLPDVKKMSVAEIKALSVADLKKVLASHHVDYSDCLEKADLVAKLQKTVLGQ